MNKMYNKRADELAEEHSRAIKNIVKDILYWIYSFFVDLPHHDAHQKKLPQSRSTCRPDSKPQRKVKTIEVVAFFVSPKGERLCKHIKEQGHLDQSVTRDLYSYTEYMWSGTKDSNELQMILNLFNQDSEVSCIPQMDFYVVIAPVVTPSSLGTSREDTSNRITLFESLCSNNVDVKVSNRITYNKLPKEIVFTL